LRLKGVAANLETTKLFMDSLKKYVSLHQSLLAEKAQLETRLNAINKALNGSTESASPKGRKKRKMSKAARAKIAAAQRARWAKHKANKK
jgi:hypothetical protein